MGAYHAFPRFHHDALALDDEVELFVKISLFVHWREGRDEGVPEIEILLPQFREDLIESFRGDFDLELFESFDLV